MTQRCGTGSTERSMTFSLKHLNGAADHRGTRNRVGEKRWWPEATSESVRAVHARLKQALDPLDILNPGKFVG